MSVEPLPALEVRDVSLTYDSKRGPIAALEHFCLTLSEREFVSILGPSGCGKSTLLKLICGLIAPTAGEIVVRGQKITAPRPEIGMVFQNPNLLPWKSVLDNILAPARAMKLDLDLYKNKARELLELVGLTSFADNYPWELSGGMQQRVSLARGLLHDPALLLMDEPFAALDAMTREQMGRELQRIWMASAKSVVFVTHSIPEAIFLSDRVVMLSGRPGKIIEERHIDLPRPRSIETMDEPNFAEYCGVFRRRFGSTG